MNNRFWGEDKDQEASKQLGLEGDHTIFMMSSVVDHVVDLREVEKDFEDLGYVSASEVLGVVEERINFVPLPKGFVLVGMHPYGADGPPTYGIVDFSVFGRE